jgi:hypothetical protein
MIKYSKLSDYQIKKIIQHFCVDIDATKTAELLELNRHTIKQVLPHISQGYISSSIFRA